MTRFTLVLVARSARWIAPLILYVLWLVLVVSNPGPALSNAASMFFGVVVFSCWITVVAGNVDDDPHRDLCAALAGSPGRLHVRRTVAAVLAVAAVALVTALLLAFAGDRSRHDAGSLVATSSAALLAAAFIGSTIGGFLHRPVLRNVAWSVTLAIAAILVVALLPPIHDVLRALNDDRATNVVALLLASAALATGATALSAFATNRING
jgi:hypothetical protein